MIDIHLLEQLLAFYECGTLSAASEKLHLSQPALSTSMYKLEEIFGVSLFERQKNKLILNENGMLAVNYAKRIIELEKEALAHIQTFAKSRLSIVLGSCAITPILSLLPIIKEKYPERNVTSELEKEETLISGLQNDKYHIIVLTHPLEDNLLFSKKWDEEHLFVSLPVSHPLADSKGLYLKDLNGHNVLLYSQTGFWGDILHAKMPDTHFIKHSEYPVLDELEDLTKDSSAWPTFKTNHSLKYRKLVPHRINIPVLDDEVNVSYYCICKKEHYKMLSDFYNHLTDIQ